LRVTVNLIAGDPVEVNSGRMTDTLRFSNVDVRVPDLPALGERVADLVGVLRPDAALDECVTAVRAWDAPHGDRGLRHGCLRAPGRPAAGSARVCPRLGCRSCSPPSTAPQTDVKVFTHEMGHAFQNFQSRDQPLSDYLWPTMESAEIHSMSLEFLAWPHMERFFGDDAERYRRAHLADALLFIPYGTAVDHFQHEMYARPNLTLAERHEVWRDLERAYLPWRDWGGLPRRVSGASWQRQRHIYAMPFYYIDYVLAQTCALQFWVRSSRDPGGALHDYVTLCGKGGSAAFGELLGSAGLRSPFDEGCLSELIDAARATLT
jgi:Peptidase family M3